MGALALVVVGDDNVLFAAEGLELLPVAFDCLLWFLWYCFFFSGNVLKQFSQSWIACSEASINSRRSELGSRFCQAKRREDTLHCSHRTVTTFLDTSTTHSVDLIMAWRCLRVKKKGSNSMKRFQFWTDLVVTNPNLRGCASTASTSRAYKFKPHLFGSFQHQLFLWVFPSRKGG